MENKMKIIIFSLFVAYVQLSSSSEVENHSPPHIIIVLADDLGWNDVSFYGSPEIPTPNLDALAMSGILLKNFYTNMLCTPSRGALLSGKYALFLGFQHLVILNGEASGLPLDVVTMPQYLKRLGYKTHMVGKWHLGYMTKYYTPTYRGFDSYFGYWNGDIDFYNYTSNDVTGLKDPRTYYGIDLHKEMTYIKDFKGSYATDVFTEKAENIIHEHNSSQPLFLFVSHAAVHTPSLHREHQLPPKKYLDRVTHIQDRRRRVHAGVATAVDESVAQIFKALSDKDMLENSIILFISDNGGEIQPEFFGASSNFPLRGGKFTLFEGGVHVPGLIWSPLFKLQKPRISKQLIHISDWLPTLYKAAGGDPDDLVDINGINMWDVLVHDLPSPRTEVVHNIDSVDGVSALRVGDWKVINGSSSITSWSKTPEYSCYGGTNITKSCNFIEKSQVRNILIETGKWLLQNTEEWRKQSAVICPHPPLASNCKPEVKPCLFNITDDPCEHHNLANVYPEIVDSLMNTINFYDIMSMIPQSKPADLCANPKYHDLLYVTWLDPENYEKCPIELRRF